MRLLLVLALSVLAVPNEHKRDIIGLLAGDSATSTTSFPTHAVLHSIKPTRSSLSPSVESTPATSHSSVEQWTHSPSSPTDFAGPTTLKTALASTSSFPPASAESQATDHSSKTWQIIGIVIITILFIATSITFALFFDRLWRFLKDVTCCTSRPPVAEEFITDCEKQSYNVRSPSLSDWNHCKAESLHDAASVYTIRPRELPWNTPDGNTLHRHPSRRTDHPPPA